MYQSIISASNRFLRFTFTQLIVFYQKCISPFLGSHCRFYPSCSEYAKEALQVFSFPKALFVITKRLLRCHPFCKGGIDPVHSHPNSHSIR